jgi:hypothetical protein
MLSCDLCVFCATAGTWQRWTFILSRLTFMGPCIVNVFFKYNQ